MSELPNLAVFYIENNDKAEKILREKKRTLEGFLAERVRELYDKLETPFSGEQLNGEDVSVPDDVVINYPIDMSDREPFLLGLKVFSTVKGEYVNMGEEGCWPGRIFIGLNEPSFGCNDPKSPVHKLVLTGIQALTQRMSGLLISEHLDYNLRFYEPGEDMGSDTLRD
ncbi:MAG: hypothetical protein AABY26_00590 [Nanoarchaeota archaeon]